MGIHGHRHDMHGHSRVKREPAITRTILDPSATANIIGFSTLGIHETTPATMESDKSSKASKTIIKGKGNDMTTSTKRPMPTTPTSMNISSKFKGKSIVVTKLKTKSQSSVKPMPTSKESSFSLSAKTVAAQTPSTTVATSLQNTSVISEKSSSGLSTGATAGIVGVVVALVLIVTAVGIFIYRKKTQKSQEAYGKTEDEKSTFSREEAPMSRAPSPVQTITSEKAPRVSLRPVTQFLPNLNVDSQRQPQSVGRATLGDTSIQNISAIVPTSSLYRSESRKAPPPALVLGGLKDSQEDVKVLETASSLIAPVVPKSPTPSGFTEYSVSTTPGTPIAGISKAKGTGSPVHRVQVDFAPSMGDELGLRAGQLVRILHEYDDGWALCVRLDRSQQGVCPRTCLSQKPVKPRPQEQRALESPPNRQRDISRNCHPQSFSGYSSQARANEFVGSQPSIVNRDPASPVPRSPGGYQKPQYVPASGRQSPHPQLPIAPQIVISTSPSNSQPTPPSGQQMRPQSPNSLPPAVVPIRPSPLSKESIPECVDETSGTTKSDSLVFHAM